MIDSIDKKIYFSMSFLKQMTELGGEVENILKYDKQLKIKTQIKEKGKDAYGKSDYTHAIDKLFRIVKADPKNKPILREIYRAEQELISFLYDEPGAPSEQEIYSYWNAYMWAYVIELGSQPPK